MCPIHSEGRIRVGSEATSNLRLLLGNKLDWRSAALEHLSSNSICMLPYSLTTETIELDEVSAILPFELEEYRIIQSSRRALEKSLIPQQAHVE